MSIVSLFTGRDPIGGSAVAWEVEAWRRIAVFDEALSYLEAGGRCELIKHAPSST